jgi:hypothetical protein
MNSEHQLRVGQGYNSAHNGRIFAWEAKDATAYNSTDSFEDFKKSIRHLEIGPYQVENSGTSSPIETNPLSEDKEENILRYLGRPIVRVYHVNNENEKHTIEAANLSLTTNRKNILGVLKNLGCEQDDLIFYKTVGKKTFFSNPELVRYIREELEE